MNGPRHIQSVCVVGGGVALWLATLALRKSLPAAIDVTALEARESPPDDALYGTLLPPETYAFHLEHGIDEPTFLQSTRSGFAYGTAFLDWAGTGRSWVSAFASPLPTVAGVRLARLVSAQPGASLQSLLIGAEAVRRGVFAHPPEDPAHPLSKAEYGYLADPADLAAFYRSRCGESIRIVSGKLESVHRDTDSVKSVTLTSGESVAADIWIDASGTAASLIGERGEPQSVATLVRNTGGELGRPATIVRSTPDGWSVQTQLRGANLSFDRTGLSSGGTIKYPEGVRAEPWRGNVLAIGTAAAIIPPLTCAPFRLLLRDIARACDLFPISTDMRIERDAYTTAATEAAGHAHAYHLAHFADINLPDGAASREAAGRVARDAHPPDLARRLRQQAERGYHVKLDNEPFDADAWAILHDGMGRRPRRADPLAANAPQAEIEGFARERMSEIAATVPKMPPHALYMAKFLDYLRRREAAHG